MTIDFEALKEPFPADQIHWRPQKAGKGQKGFYVQCLAYIDARHVWSRLDDVVGPGNWKTEVKPYATGSKVLFIGGLSIKIGDEWITRWDGSDSTDIEGTKGGISGSYKRAAAQWGIGRYLYDLEDSWGQNVKEGHVYQDGWLRAETKDKVKLSYQAPPLPSWALPAGSQRKGQAATPAQEKLPVGWSEKKMNEFMDKVATGTEEQLAKARTYLDSEIKAKRLTEEQRSMASSALDMRQQQLEPKQAQAF